MVAVGTMSTQLLMVTGFAVVSHRFTSTHHMPHGKRDMGNLSTGPRGSVGSVSVEKVMVPYAGDSVHRPCTSSVTPSRNQAGRVGGTPMQERTSPRTKPRLR